MELIFNQNFSSSVLAGVAWNLGTSRGQLAPEPRQLDGVHCNQKEKKKQRTQHELPRQTRITNRRNTTEYDKTIKNEAYMLT